MNSISTVSYIFLIIFFFLADATGSRTRARVTARTGVISSQALVPPPIPGVSYSDQTITLLATHVPGVSHKDHSLLLRATSLPATHAPVLHRFLLKTGNFSLPLCFDVTGALSLKLIHHSNRELSVNGELESVSLRGFKRIVIHFKTDQHVEIDTKGITVRKGQTETRHTGDNIVVIAESLIVIKREKEIDVSVGDLRMVILIHVNAGEEFLWPVLRQKPSDTNITGILALEPVVYEEVQQIPSTKLKINNQEIDVTRSIVFDHSIISQPVLDCWLMSAESALQRPLDDFIVTQL